MKEEARWLAGAVSTKEGTDAFKSIFFVDGEMRASNGIITAGAPVGADFEGAVSGELLLKALSTMSAPVLSLTNNSLVIKSGRHRATLALQPLDDAFLPLHPGSDSADPRPVPGWLVPTLSDLQEFVSTSPSSATWMQGVSIFEDHLWASNGVVLSRSVHKLAGAPPSCILPLGAVEFLTTRGKELSGWLLRENTVEFLWSDGRWAVMQLLNDKFNEAAKTILAPALASPHMEPPPPGLLPALADLAKMGMEGCQLSKGAVEGSSTMAGSTMRVELEPGFSQDMSTPSLWTIKLLQHIMKIATHFDPTPYPMPGAFFGANVLGVVAARR